MSQFPQAESPHRERRFVIRRIDRRLIGGWIFLRWGFCFLFCCCGRFGRSMRACLFGYAECGLYLAFRQRNSAYYISAGRILRFVIKYQRFAASARKLPLRLRWAVLYLFSFLRTYIFLGSFVNVVQHAVNTPRKSSRKYGIHSKLYNISTVEVNRNGFIFSNFIKSDRSETNFYKSSNKLLCRLCNIHK